MGALLVWKHHHLPLQVLQDELIARLQLASAPLHLCPPGQERPGHNELSWYTPTAPRRAWLKVEPSLCLAAAETNLQRAAIKAPPEDSLLVAAQCMEYYMRLVADCEIDGAIIWNGWQIVPRTLAAALYRIGKPYIFAEQGLLPNSLSVDPCGVNASSSLTPPYWGHLVECGLTSVQQQKTAQAMETLCERDTTVVAGGSEDKTRALLASLDSSKPTVLVIGQLDWDSNVLQRAPQYLTNRLMLDSLVTFAEGANVLYKPHPRHTDPITAGGPFIDARHTSMKALLRSVDAVVLRTSTAGIEAILWDKPVVVLGDAIYSGRGFTTDVRHRCDLAPTLKHVIDLRAEGKYWTEDRLRRRAIFFHWLMFEHLFFARATEPVPDMSEQMLQKLRGYLE